MRELTARIRTHPGAVTALALAAICGVALFLRVYYPFDNVFVDDWVRFQGTDPWYHIRHIENLVHKIS